MLTFQIMVEVHDHLADANDNRDSQISGCRRGCVMSEVAHSRRDDAIHDSPIATRWVVK
jgi:hypothetical protein